MRGSGPHNLVTWKDDQSIDIQVGVQGWFYLWVSFNDSLPSRPVWLLGVCPEKVIMRGGLCGSPFVVFVFCRTGGYNSLGRGIGGIGGGSD